MSSIHQAILPTLDCYRLKHHTVQRLKQPGPGAYDVCVVCSMGYNMALQVFEGDEQQADEFVRNLRREKTTTSPTL